MAYPNLKAEMSRLDVTVADIASVVGKSERTIQYWLAGATEPDVKQINTIRDKLFDGYPLDYLFSGQAIKPY